jgi:hypothetical protein
MTPIELVDTSGQIWNGCRCSPSSTFDMEAAGFSKTSENFYEALPHHFPKTKHHSN